MSGGTFEIDERTFVREGLVFIEAATGRRLAHRVEDAVADLQVQILKRSPMALTPNLTRKELTS